MRVDMSNVPIDGAPGARTWPAALGISFAAGSTEDSDPGSGLREGIIEGEVSVTERLLQAGASIVAPIFKDIPSQSSFSNDIIAGHFPKPILFAVGASAGLTPSILPFQLLKIGQLALTAIPGEICTMAGRRLSETVLNGLSSSQIRHLGLAGYANDYSGYITTKEEYDKQHYEGASTLYGPYTLHAYQQVYLELARALKAGTQVGSGPAPHGRSSPIANRWTFRNLSASNYELKFFNTGDTWMWSTLPNGTKQLHAGAEVAFPEREFTGFALPTVSQTKVRLNGGGTTNVSVGNLFTIAADGRVLVTGYQPPQ